MSYERVEKRMTYIYKFGSADLHTHTNASDGLFKPKELIRQAKLAGLDLIAVTDHDTVKGIAEAIKYGKIYGVEVIAGIELNSYYENNEIHVLGYFIDINDKKLNKKLSYIKEARLKRARLMIDNLVKLEKLDISFDEVLDKVEGHIVTRPHIGRVLVEKGIVNDMDQAFKTYLGSKCPAYVERYKIEPKEAIELITNAGGVAVLAHPALIKDQELVTNYLLDLDFKGIEVYHSKHMQEDVIKYAKIADGRNLITTGGSDCHGRLLNGQLLLGQVTVSMNQVNLLKRASIVAKS